MDYQPLEPCLFTKYRGIFDTEIQEAIDSKIAELEAQYGVEISAYNWDGVYEIVIALEKKVKLVI